MSKVSEYYIIEEKIHKYQTGEVNSHFAHIEKKAQKDNQDQIVFKDGHQFNVISPFENIDIPVKEIVGEKVEKQDAGYGCNVSFGKCQVACLNTPCKDSQKKGRNDTKAFQCKNGIVFNQSLFLADV